MNRMKCSTLGEAKTCLNAIALVSLGLLLASPHGHAADRNAAGAGITWLPLTQASSPSKIAELRRAILTFLEPLRRKLFGDPDAVLTTAYFVSISPAGASQNVFPSATSTNVEGQARVCCRLRNSRCFAIYLMIVCTTIQTNLLSPRPGATPAPGS